MVPAIEEHLYCANELDFDARVLQSLAILGPHRHGALDRLAVHIQRSLLAPVLVQLDIHHGSLVSIVEDYVDIDRRCKEVRHGRLRWFLIMIGLL